MPDAPETVTAAEALDARVLQDYVRTQRREWPAGGAALRLDETALAAVDGTGRETRLLALRAHAPALAAAIEWHAAARAATADPDRHRSCRLVLPPDPPADLTAWLAARGFTYRSHALVLVRPLDAPLPAPDPTLDVRATADRALAAHTIARSYRDGEAPDHLDLRAAETWFDLPGATHLLAHAGDTAIGGGAVVTHGAYALLGQMGVLPAHRGRGVQRALLAHRLHHARDRGATLAFATSAPQGPSLRNLRRAGFAISHARISLSGRAIPSAAGPQHGERS